MLTRGVGVGEVTGDGRPDVLTSYGGNSPNARLGIFEQLPSGALEPNPIPYKSYDLPGAVEVADIDQDGWNEAVVVHEGWLRIGVYRGQVGGLFVGEDLYPVPYSNGGNPHGLAIGDVTGDGWADIVFADDLNGLLILPNLGPAPSRPRRRPRPAGRPTPRPHTRAYPGPHAAPLDAPGSRTPDGHAGPDAARPSTPCDGRPATPQNLKATASKSRDRADLGRAASSNGGSRDHWLPRVSRHGQRRHDVLRLGRAERDRHDGHDRDQADEVRLPGHRGERGWRGAVDPRGQRDRQVGADVP